MVVLIVENAKPSLRGLLSRWLVQPKAGVFVGTLSGRVRDKLWELVKESGKADGGLLIYGAQTEQRFHIRAWGDTSREPVDYDGLTLIRRATESKAHKEHYRKRGRRDKPRGNGTGQQQAPPTEASGPGTGDVAV